MQQQQQEEQVKALRKQLQDAKCEAQDLAAENERLMELSNALRSEQHRAGLVQSSPAYYPEQQQHLIASPGNQDNMQQPPTAMPSALPQAQSYGALAIQQGSLEFQQAPYKQVLQPHVMQLPQMAQSVMVPGQQQGSYEQPHMQGIVVQPPGAHLGQNMVQQPTGQSAMPSGQQHTGPAQSSADYPLPSEVYSPGLESDTAVVL